jgi:polyhydroxyalkanoate synthesis regulator phasin
MNKKLIVALLVCFAIVLTAAIASAQPYHKLGKQITNQQKAIDRGVATGKLTKDEAAIVQDNLNHIRTKFEKSYANDGRLSDTERMRLQNMLDRNERMIRKMKRNEIQRVY